MTEAAEQGDLHRRLTSGQLAMIAIGGAIGTGLFLGSGLAIGLAGPAVLISYAIGGVIALLLMGCLAEMTVAHPTSGSFGDLAEHYLGPWAGFVVRYAYWSALVLAVGTELTAVAIYMQFWLPTMPGWIWMLLFGTALLLVNAASVGLFGAVEYIFSAIKIVAILGFCSSARWWSRGRRPDRRSAWRITCPMAVSCRMGWAAFGVRSSSPFSAISASR
ncbi:amino acid permease [Sphingomonas sp. I4]